MKMYAHSPPPQLTVFKVVTLRFWSCEKLPIHRHPPFFVFARFSRRRAGSSRDSTASRAGGYAPASKYAGIGQPRVAPEVAAARAKEQEDSLKRANFDVDLELFGDAGVP